MDIPLHPFRPLMSYFIINYKLKIWSTAFSNQFVFKNRMYEWLTKIYLLRAKLFELIFYKKFIKNTQKNNFFFLIISIFSILYARRLNILFFIHSFSLPFIFLYFVK